MLSLSVGVMLSTVFINFLPEIYGNVHQDGEFDTELSGNHYQDDGHNHSTHNEQNNNLVKSLVILLGFIVMFVVEKFVHFHHSNKCEEAGHGHSHAYHLAPVNILGDAVHNFIDGLVIVGAYSVDFTLGVAATISVIFHEIPQEIADFGVLLYSGLSKKKAMLFNFISALTAILGVLIALLFTNVDGFSELILPFAAGNFIYIAASNLVPQLHRHCKLKDTIMHLFAMALGIGLIYVVTVYGIGHVH